MLFHYVPIGTKVFGGGQSQNGFIPVFARKTY
jgi:hypothetical protein